MLDKIPDENLSRFFTKRLSDPTFNNSKEVHLANKSLHEVNTNTKTNARYPKMKNHESDLFEANIRIQQLIYKAKYLNSSITYKEIMQRPFNAQLMPGVPLYCSVGCLGQNMPCKVYFKYSTEERGNLQCSASLDNNKPDPDHCDFYLEGRPKRMLVFKPHHKWNKSTNYVTTFVQQSFYLQLYSREYMEIEISVAFAPMTVKKPKKVRNPDDSVSSYECSPEMKQV